MNKIKALCRMVRISALFLTIILVQTVHAWSPLGFLRSYDPNMEPRHWRGQGIYTTSWIEWGISVKGWNDQGDKVNELKIWQNDQNALAMLKGFDVTTEAGSVAQRVNIDDDDGTRGHFLVTGDMHVPVNFVLTTQYRLTSHIHFGVYVPFLYTKLKNIVWIDQTQDITLDDQLTKELVTDNFASNVYRMGDGLRIGDWEKRGIGDIVLQGSWKENFEQEKPWLKNVCIGVRGGITIPSGQKQDEDKIMFMPYGNDGTLAIIAGGSIGLTFKDVMHGGVDIVLMHMFNNTRMRRIKTDRDQTDLLLLQKTVAHKEYGFTQQFNLYIEPHIASGFSTRIAYEYTKQGASKIFAVSNDFSSSIASSAVSLQEWTTHNFLFQIKYDFGRDRSNNRFKPQGSLFYKVPFNGKRSMGSQSIGCVLTLAF